MRNEKTAAIVVGAGSGERMGSSTSKPFLPLEGKPIIVHTLERFQDCAEVDEIVLVVKQADLDTARQVVNDSRLAKIVGITEGGQRRQDSVYAGLQWLADREVGDVLVHDGVRPFVSVEKIREVLEACRKHSAAILAVPIKDTIKQSNTAPFVHATLDRSKLWAVQTPQAFAFDLLTKAYRQAAQDHFNGTDDASLVERLGVRVKIVEGSYENIKITTPDDLSMAEVILRRRSLQT